MNLKIFCENKKFQDKLEESGFDSDVLEMERVYSAVKRWKSTYKERLEGLKKIRVKETLVPS